MEHGQKLANKVGPDYACHWWMQKHLAAKWMSPKCLRNYLTRRRRWQLLRAKLQLDEAEVSAGANLDWSRHQSCLINLRAAKTDEALCNCSCHAKFNGHEQVLGKLKRLAPSKRETERKREGGRERHTHSAASHFNHFNWNTKSTHLSTSAANIAFPLPVSAKLIMMKAVAHLPFVSVCQTPLLSVRLSVCLSLCLCVYVCVRRLLSEFLCSPELREKTSIRRIVHNDS